MNRKLYLPPLALSCGLLRVARRLASGFILWAWVSVPSAMAAVLAVADAVQAPAWIERDGRTQPLAAGLELRSGDIVRTGGGARAYLKLAEGSTVKLGEMATFVFYSRSLRPQRFFRGALDIAAGAFRFTTDALRRNSGRDVSIRVVTATIGIRGTDVWGKATQDRDLVALIEGHVELVRLGQPLGLTPMSYLDAPRDGVAEIKPLDAVFLAQLARETEIEAGGGASRLHGQWQVSAGAADDPQQALALYDQVRDAGFAAKIRPIRINEPAGWRYTLSLTGFANATEAERAARRLTALTGLSATPGR